MVKEIQAVTKLEDLINRQVFTEFDDEEIVVLKRVITMVRGFDALGSFANFVSKTVVWLGVVIGGIIAFKSGVVDFILTTVRGN